MLFIELSPFIEFRKTYWGDEELRQLQLYLLANPEAGDVIPGSGGLRKLRWAVAGRGKRGGARLIYYRLVPRDRLYLIHAYLKTEQDDLSRDQIRQLAALMKELEHG